LDHMKRVRLIRYERRVQRRVVRRRGPGWFRRVQSTFWFVDFVSILDMTRYRLHHMRLDIQHTIQTELEHQKYKCARCGRSFNALDVARILDTASGLLRCDREFGRGRLCMGDVVEEDTAGELARTRALQTRLEAELRPLLELLQACDDVHVPAHPLEGADEEVWGKFVPETVDSTGADLVAPMQEFAMYGGRAPEVQVELGADADGVHEKAADPNAIPERPSWFKQDDAADGDAAAALASQSAATVIVTSEGETAASAKPEPSEKRAAASSDADYYARFLKEHEQSAPAAAHAADNPAESEQKVEGLKVEGGAGDDVDEDEDEFDADFVDTATDLATADAAMDDSAPKLAADKSATCEPVDPDKILVSVAGEQIPLSAISSEHTDQMTADEYQDYYDKLREAGFLDTEDA